MSKSYSKTPFLATLLRLTHFTLVLDPVMDAATAPTTKSIDLAMRTWIALSAVALVLAMWTRIALLTHVPYLAVWERLANSAEVSSPLVWTPNALVLGLFIQLLGLPGSFSELAKDMQDLTPCKCHCFSQPILWSSVSSS